MDTWVLGGYFRRNLFGLKKKQWKLLGQKKKGSLPLRPDFKEPNVTN